MRFTSIQLISEASPLAARSSRRTATVTMSAPEASWQRFITSKLGYLPVPMISLDCSVWPAMTSGLSGMVFPLTPAHEGDDLDPVAVGEGVLGVARAANQLGVDLDRDGVAGKLKLGEQRGDGRGRRQLSRLAVDDELHGGGP